MRRSFLSTILVFPLVLGLMGCARSESVASCFVSHSAALSSSSVNLNFNPPFMDELAQSFEMPTSETVSKVHLKLSKLGSPTENIVVTVETDLAGAPSGVLVNGLATKTMDVEDVADGAWVTFEFASSFSLTKNTTYWIVLRGTYPASSVNLIRWDGESTNEYEDGQALVETTLPDNWQADATARDFFFRVGC